MYLQNACKFLTLYKHTWKYTTKNRAELLPNKVWCYWEHLGEHIENFEGKSKKCIENRTRPHWELDVNILRT